MKKNRFFIIAFAVLFLSVSAITFVLHDFKISMEKKELEIKKELGKKVLFEKDTVTVIDYNTLKETYTLSNGIEVSFDLVSKLNEVK